MIIKDYLLTLLVLCIGFRIKLISWRTVLGTIIGMLPFGNICCLRLAPLGGYLGGLVVMTERAE
jgi:hypothetical protein